VGVAVDVTSAGLPDVLVAEVIHGYTDGVGVMPWHLQWRSRRLSYGLSCWIPGLFVVVIVVV
jgi:hypothetical protein